MTDPRAALSACPECGGPAKHIQRNSGAWYWKASDSRAALAESHDRVCGCGDPIGHDTRAALAEDLMTVYPFDSDTAHIVIEDLATRGVLLVTEADVDRALRMLPHHYSADLSAALWAALSGSES